MKHIPIHLFFFLLASHLLAQPDIKNNWHSQWIGEADSSKPNIFQRYRFIFDVNEIPDEAIASIATDSKYWLWLNGKLVVFEGQLKRGPTPNDTYFDEVDLKSFLQKGKNTIAILVWYWGKDGFCHKSSGKAGLLFEAKLGNMIISSNNNWKISRHPCYQNGTAPYPNFRLPEHNIKYDARLDNEAWIKPTYNDEKWSNASLLGKAGNAPWNALWKRPIPLWHNSGLINYENTFDVNARELQMQLPRNISVTPYFKIEAPAGLLVDIRTDNYKGGSEPNVRTEYITKAGVQEFETPAFMNGHKVKYCFPKGVKIIDLKYRETRYNTNTVGYFNCNDVFLNTLWNKSVNTLHVNLRDGIQDSPDRERAQWWGDIVIVLEEIFYSCDKNGLPAIKKAISNLLEWQKKDSVLFSPIPAGNWDKELPGQMLAAIGKYGIWKYIHQSGDTTMIRYAYPFIKKYMGLWKFNEKGLVQHRDGGWSWHDWGDKIDEPLLDNAWYYMALEGCYNMAEYLKLNNDAVDYGNRMESIRVNFQKHFWKQNRFVSDEYKFYADDRGNGLAVCAGLVNKEQWKLLKPVLDTVMHAGPYLEKYILESYLIMNDAEAGLTRMKNRYAQMVNHPFITTLWEGWEIGSSTYGGGTYNHGWTGGPLSLLSGYVAGIRPEATGYSSYSIKPQLGNLNKISCGTLTARGFIKVDVKRENNKMQMIIETIDADGLIAFPKLNGNYHNFTVNGNSLHNDFKFLSEDSQYMYFNCAKKNKWILVGE
jgi:alpha-L-rhamnosidase